MSTDKNQKLQVITGEEFKIAEDVAIDEVKAFIEYHRDTTISYDRASDSYMDIAKDFKHMVKAVKRGLLVLTDKDNPVLTLREPILLENGNTDTSVINFRTRITKSTMAQLAKGGDIIKNPVAFANTLTAYHTQLGAVAMLDKLGKPDLGVVDEMVDLFQ